MSREAADRLLQELSRDEPTQAKTVWLCTVHDSIGNRFYCVYGDERNRRGLRVNCYTVEHRLVPVENQR